MCEECWKSWWDKSKDYILTSLFHPYSIGFVLAEYGPNGLHPTITARILIYIITFTVYMQTPYKELKIRLKEVKKYRATV